MEESSYSRRRGLEVVLADLQHPLQRDLASLVGGATVVARVLRVVVRDRRPAAIEWIPAARPFFEEERKYPQGALGTRPRSFDKSLAWYVA
jgi:hypothetical protein